MTGDNPSRWEPGHRIAGYLIEERIGEGGMALVFRAVDERLNRRVALKVLAPATASDEVFRQRFVRESRAAAGVDDPNIIPVYEAGEADGVLFIAMRLAQGDVGALVGPDRPLPPERAALIISAVSSALDAAHEQGLVHRDVKPGNILLDGRPGRPDHVYLSDFGISKATTGSSVLTQSGQFLGTLMYAAPEQFSDRPVDGRADQYAIGCVAYELLCGAPPFRRSELPALVHAHLHEPPPPLSELRPGLSPAVDPVFAVALAKDPADRYPSCGEFAAALESALGLSRPEAADAETDADPVTLPGHPPTEHSATIGNAAGTARDEAAATPAPAQDPGPGPRAAHDPDPRQPLRQGWRSHRVLLGAAGAAGALAIAVGLVLTTGGTPAAAVVGNQQVTSGTLAAQVANLKAGYQRYLSQVTLEFPASQMPQQVLAWMVRFRIRDRMAQREGIKVTSTEVRQALASISASIRESGNTAPLTVVAVGSGLPPDMLTDLGRYQAIETTMLDRLDGGKLPTSSTAQQTMENQFNRSQCLAAKSLDIKINPHYGALNYSNFTIVPARASADTSPSASKPELTPPC
jgi:serine/threonine protein kinase